MQWRRYAPPLGVCALTLLCQSVLAQQAPTAGRQLQEISPAPSAQPQAPAINVDPEEAASASPADLAKVPVKALVIRGATALQDAELIRVSGFIPQREYTLAQLRAFAARISAHYRDQGYLVARAYLPAQDVTEGTVHITVLEGQYGQITLQNRSGLSDTLARSVIGELQASTLVTAATLERSMLMLSDLPGVGVKSSLAPGPAVGTTDLLVELSPGPRYNGSFEADNHGNAYTGANRFGASIRLNELAGLGDVASVRYLGSGEGLAYGRAAYQVQAGAVSLGLAYTRMDYRLGGSFASTGAQGDASIQSLFAKYPLIRSRGNNLNLQWGTDEKSFSDRSTAGSAASNSGRKSLVHSMTLSGELQGDSGRSFTMYQGSWSSGNISLQAAADLSSDAGSAQRNGAFDKLSYAFSRQQNMSGNTDLYLRLDGQWASKNLDGSEKFSLGGPGAVRAYPTGEATGDEGAVLTLETRTRLPLLAEYGDGQWQLIGFVDAGTLRVNKTPWDTTSNTRALQGAGVGLKWLGSSQWMVSAFWAAKIGNEAATSAPDAGSRLWLQASKIF